MAEYSTAYGIYRGVVTDTRDPLGKGRLRLKVPQLMQEKVTDWAWPVDRASVKSSLPKVGQGVWVVFEGGDPNFPVWTGTFGAYKGTGYQLTFPELTIGSYPATLTRHISGSEFDVIGALADLAAKVEQIRQSLNAHGGGDTEAPPTDVAP